MAVRVRADGRILCAAMHPAEPGDDYLPDNVTEKLSGSTGMTPVLVTEPWELPAGVGRGGHSVHGEWWWANQVPDDVAADTTGRSLDMIAAERAALAGWLKPEAFVPDVMGDVDPDLAFVDVARSYVMAAQWAKPTGDPLPRSLRDGVAIWPLEESRWAPTNNRVEMLARVAAVCAVAIDYHTTPVPPG